MLGPAVVFLGLRAVAEAGEGALGPFLGGAEFRHCVVGDAKTVLCIAPDEAVGRGRGGDGPEFRHQRLSSFRANGFAPVEGKKALYNAVVHPDWVVRATAGRRRDWCGHQVAMDA